MQDSIEAYIALGDSMSIDLYPHMDLVRRYPSCDEKVGAASLLYRNNNEVWPQFKDLDLNTYFPKMKFAKLCEDGAYTHQLRTMIEFLHVNQFEDRPVLVSITSGGNDLLNAISFEHEKMNRAVDEVMKTFDRALAYLDERFPRAIVILNTIYDPTDGTSTLPGVPIEPHMLAQLSRLNDHIRKSAASTGAMLADVHAHFMGHGMTAPFEERWYWEANPIEPSARGASEIRRCWLHQMVSNKLLPESYKVRDVEC